VSEGARVPRKPGGDNCSSLWSRVAPSTMLLMVPIPRALRRGGERATVAPFLLREAGEGDRPEGGGGGATELVGRRFS
jgi:hypothetical protein